jgi:FkbM family methyltransferase
MSHMLRVVRDLKAAISAVKKQIKDPGGGPTEGELSYSAAGEDRAVLAWLQVVYQLDAPNIRYCDIGASHPKQLNNTYFIYLRGGSGVLIEPDPALIAQLQKVRPRDTVLNVGVAFDERRCAKLKRFSASVFNTFSSEQANVVVESSKKWAPDQLQEIVDEVEVPLVPVNEILGKYFSDGIHFMSIDAEGVDFLILKSIDFDRFRPKLICIEISRSITEFDAVLNPWSYELVSRTPDNAIYRLM